MVDAQEFERLSAGSPAELAEALSTYKGDFLEGDYEDWTVAERERLAAAFEAGLSRSLKISPDAQVAQRLLARNPYDEDAYATLVDAELAAGRRMAAVAYVERCRVAFGEMGAAPSTSFEQRFGNIQRGAASPEAQLQLPFVGREAEQTAIARALDAANDGTGSITVVHGEAGIGKSTLLAAATRMAALRNLRVVSVHCSDGDSRMFGPWPQIFEAVSGTQFDALAQSSGADVGVAYAEVMSRSLSPPALVLIDDAHALRGDALGILKAFVEALAVRHACVIGTRPEGVIGLREQFEGPSFDELALHPLARADFEDAFAQLTGEAKSAVVDSLFERTGGHPLFLSALLEMLSSSGLIAREGYRWRFAPDAASSLELPASLRRHIDTQFHARGSDACAVACALALEPVATTDDLIGALGLPSEAVFDALDDLLKYRLIVEPALGPQFAFSHDMIGEVAATLLSAGRRVRLHRAFAEQLRRTPARDRWLRLARHLRAAGELLDAGAAYHDAALEAIEWSAYGDVVSRAIEGIAAVERLDRSPARDELLALLKRAESGGYTFGGDPLRAIAPANDAVTYARAAAEPRVLVRTLLARGYALSEAGDLAVQLADAGEAVELARALHDDVLLAKALVQESSAAVLLGPAPDAMPALREAYDIAVRHAEWGLAASAMSHVTYASIALRRYEDAFEAVTMQLAAGRRSEPSALATAHHNRAAIWYAVERFDDALSDLAAAESILTASSDTQERWGRGGIIGPTMLFAICYLRGLTETRRGHLDAAIACVDSIGRDAVSVIGSVRYSAAYRMLAVDALLRRDKRGDLEAAVSHGAFLPADLGLRGIVGWADAPALATARLSVRQERSDAPMLLLAALTVLESTAKSRPLDVDRWFDTLSEAASRADCPDIAAKALQNAQEHVQARRAAAGALWGGIAGPVSVGKVH